MGVEMTVETSFVIAGVSLAFGIYTGIATQKRAERNETKADTAQLTTVIVKLENIGALVSKIDSEMSSIKKDSKEDREQLITLKAVVAQHDKKLAWCEEHCRRYGVSNDQT